MPFFKPLCTAIFSVYIALASSASIQPANRLLPYLSTDGAINSSTANTGLGYGPIPQGFKVDMDLRTVNPMSEFATVSNIAHFIKDLGQKDFSGEMAQQDFTMPGIRNAVISVRLPALKPTIKREYVIWALILAIHEMYSQPLGLRFRWCHYTIMYDDEEMGGLSFGRPAPVDTHERSITSRERSPEEITTRANPSPDTDVISQSHDQAANIDTRPNTSDFKVDFTYVGGDLIKEDLLLTLFWTMAQAAMPDAKTRFWAWTPYWVAGQTRFLATAEQRFSATYMTFFWLLDAMAQTADYLVNHNRYGDIKMELKVDRIDIGQGLFCHM